MKKRTVLESMTFLGLFAWMGMVTGSSWAGDTLAFSRLKTTVLVDVKLCGWSPTLCTDSGSVGVAAAGNNSVVGIIVQIPNVGLPETAFSLGPVTSPGGVTPEFVTTTVCPSCFAEPQPGVYRLAARPSSGNWASGSYVVFLTVATPGPDKTVVVPIDIP